MADMRIDTTALPTITGASEKQVAYATDMRTRMVEYATAAIPALNAYADDDANHRESRIVARFAAVRIAEESERLATETTARAILDEPAKGGVNIPATTFGQVDHELMQLTAQYGYQGSGRSREVKSVAAGIVDPAGWGDPAVLVGRLRGKGDDAQADWIASVIAAAATVA